MAQKLPNPPPHGANFAYHQRRVRIFNEWARRYAEDPESFGPILDADGKPATDYGEQCAVYYDQIAAEIDAADNAREKACSE